MTNVRASDKDAFTRLMLRQELVVSRTQVLACGMTRDALKHRIRVNGPWQRLIPGIYLTVTGTPTARQKEIAALLYGGPRSVVTGLMALRHHGLKVPETRVITVLIPAGHVRRSHDFVNVRTTTQMPETICVDGAVYFVLPERAVVDAAREVHNFREVRALVADAVQQRRCRLDWLQEELARGPVRGSAWLRRSLAEVMTGIRSGAEGDFSDLLRSSGLPMPVFNARLYAGSAFIAVADTWWAEAGVAAEVDSRQWHLSPDDWERTLQRHARMSAHGILVLHFTPSQIRQEPARVIADIRSALAIGRSRPPLPIRALAPRG